MDEDLNVRQENIKLEENMGGKLLMVFLSMTSKAQVKK